MKTVYAITALLLASPFGPAAATKVIPSKDTPGLRPSPNDVRVSNYDVLPRVESDSPLTLQGESADAKFSAAADATDEAFVDSVITGALRDRSNVDELLLRRLRIDLIPCFFQTDSEKELTQCLRTALKQYKSPEELTKTEKRRILRRARQYYHAE